MEGAILERNDIPLLVDWLAFHTGIGDEDFAVKQRGLRARRQDADAHESG